MKINILLLQCVVIVKIILTIWTFILVLVVSSVRTVVTGWARLRLLDAMGTEGILLDGSITVEAYWTSLTGRLEKK